MNELMKLADKYAQSKGAHCGMIIQGHIFTPTMEKATDEARAALQAALEQQAAEIERLKIQTEVQYESDGKQIRELQAKLAAMEAVEPVAVVDSALSGGIGWTAAGEDLEDGQELFAAPKVAQPWQPIETAPKDGKCLVLVETDDGPTIERLDRDTKGNWIHEGEPTFCHSYYFNPTHWMPLPASPAIGGQQP